MSFETALFCGGFGVYLFVQVDKGESVPRNPVDRILTLVKWLAVIFIIAGIAGMIFIYLNY